MLAGSGLWTTATWRQILGPGLTASDPQDRGQLPESKEEARRIAAAGSVTTDRDLRGLVALK
jgi:hypothetical protein